MRVISNTFIYFVAVTGKEVTAPNAGYIIGLVVAFLILCYLIYTLIKPEKF